MTCCLERNGEKMKVEKFIEIMGAEFYTGVPDSRLKALCDCLLSMYGQDPRHHVIAANEGNSIAVAAGYYLATGKIPVVYMQNSGEGNAMNPMASLLNEHVYGIPVIFVVGWRGEPGVQDEPQHAYQGEITEEFFKLMGVEIFVLDRDTAWEDADAAMAEFRKVLNQGKDVAFLVKTGALSYDRICKNSHAGSLPSKKMTREEIICQVTDISGEDPVITTTGKASRELFEIREARGQGHQLDFLTVGSMGHSSSVAMGIALHQSDKKVWCIDGDGAVLMHMGAMAVIAQAAPGNLVHLVVNNGAHESVGGMPTAAASLDLWKIAQGCGYRNVYCVQNREELAAVLKMVKEQAGPSFVEVKAAVGARENLGRPTSTPQENKKEFMKFLWKGMGDSYGN